MKRRRSSKIDFSCRQAGNLPYLLHHPFSSLLFLRERIMTLVLRRRSRRKEQKEERLGRKRRLLHPPAERRMWVRGYSPQYSTSRYLLASPVWRDINGSDVFDFFLSSLLFNFSNPYTWTKMDDSALTPLSLYVPLSHNVAIASNWAKEKCKLKERFTDSESGFGKKKKL